MPPYVWRLYWAAYLLLFASSRNILATTLPPRVLPLALRSPYLHTWTSNPIIDANWPMYWNKDVGSLCRSLRVIQILSHSIRQTLGWEAMIRIDNQTYRWLGFPPRSPKAVFAYPAKITPTQTIFAFSAGPARIVATFLSPIEVIAPILSFHYKHLPTF